jgi:hypothetical protein
MGMPQGSGGLTMEFPSPSRTKQWNYLTHNTLAKEKSTKGKATIYKTYI